LVICPVKFVPEMTYCVEWDVKPYTLTHSLFNWQHIKSTFTKVH